MKNRPFARRLRQFRFLIKQINQQIQNGQFAALTASKQQQIIQKAHLLYQKIRQVIPAALLRKTLAKATFLFVLGGGTAQAQMFAPPVTNPFGLEAQPDFFTFDLVDIDNDGDLDMFGIGNPNNGDDLDFYLIENTGTPTAPQLSNSITLNPFGVIKPTYATAPSFADMDNDGDFDLFIGQAYSDSGEYGLIRYYENVGTASAAAFEDRGDNVFGLKPLNQVSIPNLIDLDDDGDMDMMATEYLGTLQYFENIGTATAPNFSIPNNNPFGLAPLQNGYTELVLNDFADIDNDGDLDALFFGAEAEYNSAFFYQENTGSASQAAFAANQENPFEIQTDSTVYLQYPVFADLDGDGDTDLLTVVYGDYNSVVNYYENTTISSVENTDLTIQMDISPNPTQDILRLQAELPNSHQDLQISIYDASGRVFLQEKRTTYQQSWRYNKDVTHLPSGLYFVKITSTDFSSQVRFIKE